MAAEASSASPYVLLHGGDELGDITSVAKPLGRLDDVITSAIVINRDLVIETAKRELKKTGAITGQALLDALDVAGLLFLRRFNALVGPAAAAAYLKAYRDAGAGDVPITTIYALAESHSDRLGTYFHETSKEALIQGFNTYVNRNLPARVAAERALDVYGLTPKQVSGYTSMKVATAETVTPMNLLQRAKTYIGTSIRRRAKIFAEQESHNVDLQAKQTAWLWMQEQGLLGEDAQKVWLTAKDERTCKVCAPMHGQRAKVGEKFTLPNGFEVWVAGVHPNCRCEIKISDLSVVRSVVQKDRWFDDERARTSDGRFSRYRQALPKEARKPKYTVKERRDDTGFQNLLDQMFKPEEEKPKPPITFGSGTRPTFGSTSFGRSKSLSFGQAEELTFGASDKEKITFGGPTKRRLHPEKSSLSFGVKQRIEFEMGGLFDLPLPAPTPHPYRPTISLPLEAGSPAWAVISDPERFDHDGRVMIDEHVTFHTNRDKASSAAKQEIEERLSALHDEIDYDEGAVYDRTTRNGEAIQTKKLSSEAIEEAVGYILSGPSDQGAEPRMVPVEIFDIDEQYVGREMISIAVAANIIGKYVDDSFRVRVVRLVDGYAEERQGGTWLDQNASRTGDGIWRTVGTYEALPTERETYTGFTFIEHYDLIPEVRDETIYEDLPMRFDD